MTKRELNKVVRETSHKLLDLTGIDSPDDARRVLDAAEAGMASIRAAYEAGVEDKP